MLYDRLGHELKRLLGREPVRFRRAGAETRFLLNDCTDRDAGLQVIDAGTLQLAGGDTSPLVVDIDSLHPTDKVTAADALFASERLQCAARLLGAVLRSKYAIEVHWFSSGKQGLHGWGFGTSLTAASRRLVAQLLPIAAAHQSDRLQMFEVTPAYSHPDVQAEVEAGLSRLLRLDLDGCSDREWVDRLRAAATPNASSATKLLALTAFYDVAPTRQGTLRLPCSYNEKDGGYVGFPLPSPCLDGTWPHMRRAATITLSSAELDMLASIELPSQTARDATLAMLNADLSQRKRPRSDSSEGQMAAHAVSAIPRLHPRSVALPSDPAGRATLIPIAVRTKLPEAAIRALERGVARGGMPPCLWLAEPDNEHRRRLSLKSGGVGTPSLPLALDVLVGLDVPPEKRGCIILSLVASSFPVDCFAEAMVASNKTRGLRHFAAWFRTCAAGENHAGAAVWRYDAGRLDSAGVSCQIVRSQCAKAAALLCPPGGGGGGSNKRSRPAAASRLQTGRIVELRLVGTKDAMLARVKPALEARASKEATSAKPATERFAELVKRAEDSLASLYSHADPNGTVTFTECHTAEGRFNYSSGSFHGVKSVLREVRAVLFEGAWRVDLKRCHTSMLVGAHARSFVLGMVPSNPMLECMHTDLTSLEAELKADQMRLLPAAIARLEADNGSNAAKLVDYLRCEPKTLLSALLNHPNDSPMFNTWPLAAECCRALGVAAAAARSHPLVAADQFRPELCPDRCPRGSAKEKQQIAFILERRAVKALVAALQAGGFAPSLTINDEVIFPAIDPLDVATLESHLAAAVREELGFDAPLRVERV